MQEDVDVVGWREEEEGKEGGRYVVY